jgi:hypothetical protein
VVEDVAQITAIDPAAAGRASNEMLGLACGSFANSLAEVLAAWASAKLLHHDPVALDFVQFELDRRGSFRRFPVSRLDLPEDFTLVAK